MSYTPGPWRAEQRCDRNSGMRIPAWRIYGPGLSGVIVDLITSDALLGSTTAKQHANAETNAQLIASAPELLEAAKHAVMEWRLHGSLTDSARVLEAAIAKATKGE